MYNMQHVKNVFCPISNSSCYQITNIDASDFGLLQHFGADVAFHFRSTIWSVLVLMPIMGVNWIFGFFAMNEETVVFQFIFAIVNSFQVKKKIASMIQFSSVINT